jgi:sialate O-acetylesterase
MLCGRELPTVNAWDMREPGCRERGHAARRGRCRANPRSRPAHADRAEASRYSPRVPLLPLAVLAASCAALPPQQPTTNAFRAAPLFGSHMVLPAKRAVAIHGLGPVGAEVTFAPSWGDPVAGPVRGDGRWSLEVHTPASGETGSLQLRCSGATIAIDDVLFGDVWLASGQSNMEMPVGRVGGWNGVTDHAREIAEADWPELRVFTAQRQTANEPIADIQGEWVVCTPATVPHVSATGYFFARELLRAGRGPLGLVVSSWGGTRVQAWTSAPALAKFERYAGELTSVRIDADQAVREAQRDAYWDAVAAAIPNATPTEVQLPETWSQGGLGDFDGAVDYRRTIVLPPSLRGHDLWLDLGPIDDMDVVTWNGVEVGSMRRDGGNTIVRR